MGHPKTADAYLISARRHAARAALRGNRTLPDAAVALGIHVRTLQRWIAADPEIARGIDVRGQGWAPGRRRKPEAMSR